VTARTADSSASPSLPPLPTLLRRRAAGSVDGAGWGAAVMVGGGEAGSRLGERWTSRGGEGRSS
jgi:hypothetical protein